MFNRSQASIGIDLSHIYMGIVLRAHPVHGESHIQCNANWEAAIGLGLEKIYHHFYPLLWEATEMQDD